jgi:hypothetical protein
LSKLEILQFGMEFSRLADLHQLYRRGSCQAATTPEVQPVYRAVKNCVDTIRPYTAASHDKFLKVLGVSVLYCRKSQTIAFPFSLLNFSKFVHATFLQGLDVFLKTSFEIYQRELLETFSAISSTATSWYKCPCGSIYAVENCGQFRDSSRCPDCNQVIGGGSTNNARIADAHQPPALAYAVGPMPDF